MRLQIILLALILSGCIGLKIETQYDQKADFTQYKTWCWMNCDLIYQGPEYLYDSALIDNIANSIAQEMHSKGYVQGDENSDMMVDFHLIFKKDSTYFAKVNMHDENMTFWTPYQEEYFHFIDGSLLVDIADRRNSKIIWRSNMQRLLSYKEEIPAEKIRQGIKRAMAEFPPESDETK